MRRRLRNQLMFGLDCGGRQCPAIPAPEAPERAYRPLCLVAPRRSTAMRVKTQGRLHPRRQSVEALPHVGDAARQVPHPEIFR
jgi:hypothetical protein